jgi:chorismate mutase
LKNGIRNTIQAIKKKTLPNIAQKFPRLDIIKPIAEIKNKTHPAIFIILVFIY